LLSWNESRFRKREVREGRAVLESTGERNKSMRRAFKYRATLSKETEQNAFRWLSLCQELYNAALEERIGAYKKRGLTISEYDQAKALKVIKTDRPEYDSRHGGVGSQVLKDVLRRLDRAYKAFFRRVKSGVAKPGFPKFQARHRYESFTFPNSSGWKIDGRFLYIENVGRFKLYPNRPIIVREVVNGVSKATIEGMELTVATVTVRKTAAGRWFVVFSCKDVPNHPLQTAEIPRAVGIDAGITHFATDSDNARVDNPRWYEKAEKRLRVLQRKLSRAKKGSKRREAVRLQVARLHEQIANRREDFACKLAHDYAQRYDRIAVEKLNIKDMTKSGGEYPTLPKRIHDAAWRQFQFRLESQCEDHGKEFAQPEGARTTMTCSNCGAEKEMPLNVRVYECFVCGNVMDRTYNSALNIKARAFP
jgi:putative transposase